MTLLEAEVDRLKRKIEPNSAALPWWEKISGTFAENSAQELFNGWTGRVNDPAEANNLVRIYGKLWQTTEFLKTIEILEYVDRWVLVRWCSLGFVESICFGSIDRAT